MESLIANLKRVLLILNASAGVVAFVWLIILGQWWAIGMGFVALAAPFLLIVLAIPGTYLGVPALSQMDKGNPTAALALIAASKLYEWAIFTGWFALVFALFLWRITTQDYLALLIWAYSMALAPWLYMAQSLRRREMGGDSTRLFILASHCAYLAAGMMVFCGWFAPISYILVFGLLTGAGSVAGTIFAFKWHYRVSQQTIAARATAETTRPH